MKKLVSVLLSSSLFLSGFTTFASDAPEIKVFVDGEQLQFDVLPIAENGRTLVPMRAIFEKLDCEVDYKVEDGKTTVFAKRGNDLISIGINEMFMTINNNKVELDVPAKIIDNRTVVPIRAVSEGLKADVQWDGENNSVIITTNDNTYEQLIQILSSMEVGTAGSTEKAKESLDKIVNLIDDEKPSLDSISGDFSSYLLSLSGEDLDIFNERIELLYNAYLEKVQELTKTFAFEDEGLLAKYDFIAQSISNAGYKDVKYIKPEFVKYEDNATYTVGNCTKIDSDKCVLELELLSDNIYDAVEVSQIKQGDLLYCNNGIIVVDTIEETENGYSINGGLDNFGAWLAANEGGTYIEELMDSDIAKTKVATAELAISDDCVYTNGIDLDKEPVVTNGKENVINQLIVDDTFVNGTSSVVIENGVIIEINTIYHP